MPGPFDASWFWQQLQGALTPGLSMVETGLRNLVPGGDQYYGNPGEPPTRFQGNFIMPTTGLQAGQNREAFYNPTLDTVVYPRGQQLSGFEQRHEIGHRLGQGGMGGTLPEVPQWAMDWAQQAYGYPLNPENPQQSPEVAANLYALGFGNPPSAGAGGPSEDQDAAPPQVTPSEQVPSWLSPAVQQIEPYIAPPQPTVTAEWGEQNSDGSVTVYNEMSDGSIIPVRTEPWWINQGQDQSWGGMNQGEM